MGAHLSGKIRRSRDLLETTGVRVVSWDFTGGNHVRFLVELPDGSRRPLYCASSTSDWRSEKNLLARVRRWSADATWTSTGTAARPAGHGCAIRPGLRRINQ